MNTKDIHVLFWDNPGNYNIPDTQTQLGIVDNTNQRYKSVSRFYGPEDYERIISNLEDSDLILIICHVDFRNDYEGYKRFELFLDNYAQLREKIIYVSSNKDAHEDFIKKQSTKIVIHTYSEVNEKVRADSISAYKKQTITNTGTLSVTSMDNNSEPPKYKYAIITALYEDEFEQIEDIFNFYDKTTRHGKVFKIGHLKGNKEKKVIATFQSNTGMIDSAILASIMLSEFKPTYLLMPGVCGGAANYSFGDIIIAKRVYPFQKGKLSDLSFVNEKGESEKVEKDCLYTPEGEKVDITRLFDKNKNPVFAEIEKFEIEHDAIIGIDTAIEDMFRPELKSIKKNINDAIEKKNDESFFSNPVSLRVNKIEIEPIACSTMVVNKSGYFEKTLKAIDRKTAAVEMEGYGIFRACKFLNGGKTIPILFKSVMDNTKDKEDAINGIDVKRFAAFTSAQFLKNILENNII